MVKVIAPPAVEPVTLAEFQMWMQGLPISREQEPMVNSLLKAGREEAEAYQNAAYCEQTLQLTIELEPPCPNVPHAVAFPRPPFRELKSVTAISPDGTQQDVTAQFDVHNYGGPAVLALKSSASLPDFCRLQAVYTAGYDAVPEKVRQAILLYATWAWMRRGGDTTVPAAFYALLSKGRVIPV